MTLLILALHLVSPGKDTTSHPLFLLKVCMFFFDGKYV
jgi:hypothetical protein